MKPLENLAISDPILSPEHERRKLKLRARLKAEHMAPAQTVVSHEEIKIRDAAYWAHPSEFRLRYMAEAEEARKKWARIEKEPSKRGRPRKAPESTGPTPTRETVKPLKRKRLAVATERSCRICGTKFKSIRPDATLCSARCRKQASRSASTPSETAHVTL